MTFSLHELTLCACSIRVLQRFVGFVPLLRAGASKAGFPLKHVAALGMHRSSIRNFCIYHLHGTEERHDAQSTDDMDRAQIPREAREGGYD